MGRTMGREGDTEPMSRRVQVAPDWELEPCGAANDVERVWMYPSGERCVRIVMEHDGRGVMCCVPCEVLAHVLRVQGYAVVLEAEAAE